MTRFGKEIIDYKYKVEEPNYVLCCPTMDATFFWKGVIWAAKAAKMVYQLQVGNGRKIRFWEDHWLGTSSLAIQY
jgi:hypothetical protein